MDELLRFTVIRPAEAVEGRFHITHSTPASTAAATGGQTPPDHPGTLDEILGRTAFKAAHLSFNTSLGDGPDYACAAISAAAEQKYGRKPAQLITTNEWKQDLATLSDAAIDILRAGHDKPSSGPRLLLILQGIDLVQRSAGATAGTFRRRPVEIAPLPQPQGTVAAVERPSATRRPHSPPRPGLYASRGMAFEVTAEPDADPGSGGSDYENPPTGELPSGKPGVLRPIGVGDLIVVREHILRYQGGELSHIENVLKSELRERETRRFERSEDTYSTETETSEEEERDTQTTDRFSLQREASSVVKEDSSLKAGLNVTARYGFSVEVKADVAVAQNRSEETSLKQASAVSRDVTSRAASRLSEKTRQAHVRKTIAEFEEFNKHAFDNKPGAAGVGGANISGLYQWVNRVTRAQMYNYGSRLLFDTIVPEPAAFLIDAVQRQGQSTLVAELPPPLTENASDVTESSYRTIGRRYRATGLEPAPGGRTDVGKVLEGATGEEPGAVNKTLEISVPDGYEAVSLHWAWKGNGMAPPGGSTFPNLDLAVGAAGTWDSAGSTYTFTGQVRNSLGIGVSSFETRNFVAAFDLRCARTPENYEKWQNKTYDAIVTAYTAMKQAYDKAVSEAQVQALGGPQGRNPAENRDLVLGELKKACISLLTQDLFDGFGAVTVDPVEKFPQIDLGRARDQAPCIRFFEQAFEWENIQYLLYPYFWSQKSRWRARALTSDTDPAFAEFLRAGAARVVFPVRPGFEDDVRYFVQFGKIWGGGPVPGLNQPDYVPISEEIRRATGAPGNERPVGDPWEIEVPTDLVRLKTKTALPVWEQDASGAWKESAATAEP
ncbi:MULTISPECIES: hypothetical protein [Streptomyces]|uniref:hypothetical protein n=1 Tax=Streptomyces TaxID=1883 RepID=UPI00167A9CBC|nr:MULTISPECIES: hypothetical protein [Streptomyces]MBD3575586.1 hypothetical protein [Streptomyces sp. KD18]GGT21757.1 hypothetical protein GCM10010286_54050 [Streptomyces toxytricini]